MQIYSSGFVNPNAGFKPDNIQGSALYYNDPAFSTVWGWSRQLQAWMPIISTVFQAITYTSGTPTTPSNTQGDAIAYDPTGVLPTLYWNTTLQMWK